MQAENAARNDDRREAAPPKRLQAPAAYQRPWSWPFEGKRLEIVRALQVSLFFLLAALVLRVIAAATLDLTSNEAWLWGQSEKLQPSYPEAQPLALWILHGFTAVLGHHVFVARLPALALSVLSTFWLIRLAARMGWAKGTDAIAILCLTAPLFFFGGLMISPDLVLVTLWIGMMDAAFLLGLGYEQRTRGWLRLGALIGAAVLAKTTALLGVLATALWIATTPAGRRALRTPGPWLAALPLVMIGTIEASRGDAWLGVDLHGPELAGGLHAWLVFWAAQCLLYGPALVYGWFLLLGRAFAASRRDAENHNLRFLAIWAATPAAVLFLAPLWGDSRAPCSVLAFIPVVLYFAKISAAGLGPRLLRSAVSWSMALTATGLICLQLPQTFQYREPWRLAAGFFSSLTRRVSSSSNDAAGGPAGQPLTASSFNEQRLRDEAPPPRAPSAPAE